jgi:DNA modification methylase
MLKEQGYKDKDLIGIPWMLAFALRADGWFLRQDLIWHKPNPMPESVKDRCTKSHEYIFLLSKSKNYYYDADAIKEPIKDDSIKRLIQDIENQKGSDRVPGKTNGTMKAVSGKKAINIDKRMGINGTSFINHKNFMKENGELLHGTMANKKSVWTITTKPYKEAHFATFPEDLISPCIKAGSAKGDIVLDPFGGSGTTADVSRRLGRKCISIELNKEYCDLYLKRRGNNMELEL